MLDDNKLRPAGQPDLKPSSDMDKVLAGGEDLAFELAVEVMPDFEPIDPASIELTKPVYKVSTAEVDEALADLAKQARTYEPRTGKSLKAKDGDQLLIDFVGTIDGVAFDGGTATDAELTLGSGQFIPGFEDQLVGAKPGDDVTVKVNFPADYQAANLAGKAAEFATTVKEVRAPVDAEPDDELAKRLGLTDLAALKDLLKSNLEGRYSNCVALQAEARPAGHPGQQARLRPAAAHGRRRVRRHLATGPGRQDPGRPAARGRRQDGRPAEGRVQARSPSAACAWAWCSPRSAARTTWPSPSRNWPTP